MKSNSTNSRIILTTIMMLLTIYSFSTNYYSRQDGAFNSRFTWSTTSHTGAATSSAPCNCSGNPPTCTINGNDVFYIKHAVTINCNLNFSGSADLIVGSGGSLTVTGNYNLTGNALFDVQGGGAMSVSGNFIMNSSSTVIISGNLSVSGNLNITSGTFSCDSTNLILAGSVSGSNSCGSVILPVTLYEFSSSYQNNTVKLFWSTLSEINNLQFVIEKSYNNKDYIPIGDLEGVGNSNELREYEFEDRDHLKGIIYYRVKQIDYNGTETILFSTVVNTGIQNEDIVLLPGNPTTSSPVYIQTNNNVNLPYNVEVYTITGTLVDSFTVVNRQHQFFFKSSGIYLISIQSGNEKTYRKIVVN